jgi:uncharacterized protein YjbJ (UPF0337 family)
MDAKAEQVKGRGKQAAGVLLNNSEMEEQGKADRRHGETKQKIEDTQDKARDVAEKVIDKVGDVAEDVHTKVSKAAK